MVNGRHPRPLLGCANVGHGVCLTWLASAGSYALESSTLLQPASWQPVPVQPWCERLEHGGRARLDQREQVLSPPSL